MQRLILIRHAATSASDAAAFPLDEPLSDSGQLAARSLQGVFAAQRAVPRVLSSPALRCRQTAAAAGLEPVLEPAIGECDFGCWAGRTLAEIDAGDPVAAGAWMTDPDARPHGGESLSTFFRRVAGWLEALAGGETIAFTHGGVVKAAVVHALAAPIEAVWRVGVAPLSVTELIRRCATWELVGVNRAAGPIPNRAPGEFSGSRRRSAAPRP